MSFEVFQTSINSLTVLHCSCPSKNVRRILAGGRACHSAFGATSRCDFLQCRYQCMWERTSLAKRQAFQHVSDLFLRSLLSCRLASNWNHKLQSTSICMSSHAQNLTFSNVHSCQCQNCSCSELLHASSWFPFAAQCRCLLDGIDLRSIQPNMISFNSSLSACETGQQRF